MFKSRNSKKNKQGKKGGSPENQNPANDAKDQKAASKPPKETDNKAVEKQEKNDSKKDQSNKNVGKKVENVVDNKANNLDKINKNDKKQAKPDQNIGNAAVDLTKPVEQNKVKDLVADNTSNGHPGEDENINKSTEDGATEIATEGAEACGTSDIKYNDEMLDGELDEQIEERPHAILNDIEEIEDDDIRKYDEEDDFHHDLDQSASSDAISPQDQPLDAQSLHSGGTLSPLSKLSYENLDSDCSDRRVFTFNEPGHYIRARGGPGSNALGIIAKSEPRLVALSCSEEIDIKKRNRLSTIEMKSPTLSLFSEDEINALKRRSMIDLDVTNLEDIPVITSSGSMAEALNEVSRIETTTSSQTVSSKLSFADRLPPSAPPGGSRSARAAAKQQAQQLEQQKNTVMVMGQKVELRQKMELKGSASTKRVNSIRKSLIKLGSFGKDKEKEKEKDKDKEKDKEKDKDKDKDIAADKDKSRKLSKKDKDKERLRKLSSDSQMRLMMGAVSYQQAGGQTPASPHPQQSFIERLQGGQKTPEVRSPTSGVVSPSANAQKRISGPQAADAEQLQKISAAGLNTVQQMLQAQAAEYERLKKEYHKNPTEDNHTKMETQAKILKRLEAEASKQRLSSLSSDNEMTSPSPSADSPGGGGGETPSLSSELRDYPKDLPPHPPRSGRGHKKMESVSGIGERSGLYESSAGRGGAEGGMGGSTLCRSRSDSYKNMKGEESGGGLRTTASTDEIGKMMTSREAVRKRFNESNYSRSIDAQSDDMSDQASDRLSPLREFGSLHESGLGDSGSSLGTTGADSYNRQIMSAEDGELSSEDENVGEQVFTTFSNLKKKPAHLAVFLNYLLSNCDPSPLLFYLVTESYAKGALKDLRKWAYEIYATFLVDKAVLKINVDDGIVESINNALLTKYEKEDVMKCLFEPVRDIAEKEINYQIQVYNDKQLLGMKIYGETELTDDLDHNAELKIIETYLIHHVSRLLQDEEDERNAAIASAIATFFRLVGYSSAKTNHMIERCTSFNTKEKTKLLRLKYKRAHIIKGHHMQVQQYYSETHCNICGLIVGGIGTQTFQCQRCELNVHRQCLEKLEAQKENCTGKKEKNRQPTTMLGKMLRKPSNTGVRPTSMRPSALVEESRMERTWSMPSIREVVKLPTSQSSAGTPLQPPQTSKSPLSSFSLFSHDREHHRHGADNIKEGHVSRQVEKFEGGGGDHSNSCSPDDSSATRHQFNDKLSLDSCSVDGDVTGSMRSSVSSTQVSQASINLKPSSDGSTVLSETPTIYLQHQYNDSDFETETELPALEVVLGKEIHKKLKPKDRKRQEVINELFYTERAHVRNLKVMQKLFYLPMKNDLPADFVQILFPNIDDMIEVHGKLNSEFKRLRKENSLIGDISDVLVKSFCDEGGERFKTVCAQFCERQSHSLELLKARQRKDQKFLQFLQDVQSNPLCRRLELKDFIPTTMQRLTKYPLLIESLLKHTTSETEEYDKLMRADAGSKALLSHVNEAVQLYENHQKLVDLQKRLDKRPIETSTHPGVQDYKNLDLMRHKLLYDGSLTWRISRDKLINVHVLLLNDILLLLQKQDDRLVLKCQSMFITQGKDDTKMTHSPIISLNNLINRSVATDKRAFFLVSPSSKDGTQIAQIYDLVASSKDEKNKWCKYITEAVDACKTKNKTPALKIPEKEITAASAAAAAAAPVSDTADMNQEVEIKAGSPDDTPAAATAVEGEQDSSVTAEGSSEAAEKEFVECELPSSLEVSTGSVLGLIKREDDDEESTLLAPIDKLRQIDDRIVKLMVEKARLIEEITGTPTDEPKLDQVFSSEPGLRGGSVDARHLVLSSISKTDELVQLLNVLLKPTSQPDQTSSQSDQTGSQQDQTGSTVTTPTDEPSPDSLSNPDAEETVSQDSEPSAANSDAALPVSDMLGVVSDLQKRLNSVLEMIVVKDDENSRLTLELQLAHKQLDSVCGDVRQSTLLPHDSDSRPVSLVSVSSSDDLIGYNNLSISEPAEGKGEESDDDTAAYSDADTADQLLERGGVRSSCASVMTTATLKHDDSSDENDDKLDDDVKEEEEVDNFHDIDDDIVDKCSSELDDLAQLISAKKQLGELADGTLVTAGSEPEKAGNVPESAGNEPESTDTMPSDTGNVPESAGALPSDTDSAIHAENSAESCDTLEVTPSSESESENEDSLENENNETSLNSEVGLEGINVILDEANDNNTSPSRTINNNTTSSSEA